MERKNEQTFDTNSKKELSNKKTCTEKYPELKKTNINKFCKIVQIDE